MSTSSIDAPVGPPGARVSVVGALRSIWLPLTIYAASRVASSLMLWWSARSQDALTMATPVKVTRPLPASPSLLEVSTNWDGQWYWEIVTRGYPRQLPSPDDLIQQTTLGFFPGYPSVVGGTMSVTGMAYPLAAVLVSTVAGAVAMVVIHRLLLRTVSPFVAAANITLLCVWPAAAVLQVAYTESLALLLVAVSLFGLASRRYPVAALAAVGLCLVRPLGVPLAVAALAHVVARWRDDGDPFPVGERWRAALPLLGCALGTLAWPVIAAVHTGDPWIYFHAIEAWASGDERSGGWFGSMVQNDQWLLLAVVTLTVLAILRGLRGRPGGRTWPREVRVWAGAYLLFVLASTQPTMGIARYLLLLIVPFWPFPDDSRPESRTDAWARKVTFGVLVVLALAGQYWWVSNVFVIDESPLLQSYP